MLRINKPSIPNHSRLPFRGALLSSGVVAFAGLGDAFLYPLLPVYGKEMGFSVFFIGILLSINRFVRIVANTSIANLVHQVGSKKVLLICAFTSVMTTIIYGLQVGFMVFLIARIVWGLSYSGLKIATLNFASQVSHPSGIAFGLIQGIKSLGGLFALLYGPLLVEHLGVQNGLFGIALMSCFGIGLAYFLPTIYQQYSAKIRVKTSTTFSLTPINLLVFVLSISIDGILVVSLAQLLSEPYSSSAQLLTLVAFFLLLKHLFGFGISFLSSLISLWISPQKLYYFSVVGSILALLSISFGMPKVGIVLAFLFNTLIVTYSPLIAIQNQTQNNNSLQAISGITTWWDLGAALGAFIGISLIDYVGTPSLFLVLASIVSAIFINLVRQNGNTNSRTV